MKILISLSAQSSETVFGCVTLKGKELLWEDTPVSKVKSQLKAFDLSSLKYGKDWEYGGDIGEEGDIYVKKAKGEGKDFSGRTGLSQFVKYLGL